MAGMISFESEKYESEEEEEILNELRGVDDEIDGLTLNGKG